MQVKGCPGFVSVKRASRGTAAGCFFMPPVLVFRGPRCLAPKKYRKFAFAMIKIEGIRKSFDRLEVLKGIDLHIREREVVSIVGPSGAGKTTLLQVMGTLYRPDAGSLVVDGEDVLRLNSRRLARFRNEHIGFVFQFHQLLPEFTAGENVMIPALIARRNKSEARRRAAELLEYMGLADRIGHKPAELSGGEKQRVAVARALMNNPAVVLADEPSGSLDSRNKAELHQLFFDLRDRFGQTFVIVTHDEELARLTDRTIHLVDGRVSDDTAEKETATAQSADGQATTND